MENLWEGLIHGLPDYREMTWDPPGGVWKHHRLKSALHGMGYVGSQKGFSPGGLQKGDCVLTYMKTPRISSIHSIMTK